MHFSVDPAIHKNYCHVARYPLVSLYIIVVFFIMLVVCMHPGRPGEYTLLLDLIQVAFLAHRPLSRRLDRCDRVIQNESRDPFGGNVYYVTMQITFLTRKFRNGERNLHCDVVHITTKWVSIASPSIAMAFSR